MTVSGQLVTAAQTDDTPVRKADISKLPALRSDLTFLPLSNGAGSDRAGSDRAVSDRAVSNGAAPEWTLYDPARAAYFKIGWIEHELLQRWHLNDAASVLDDINQNTTLYVDHTHLDALIQMLVENELLRASTTEQISRLSARRGTKNRNIAKQFFSFSLYYRKPLFNPDAVLDVIEHVSRPLFRYKKTTLTAFGLIFLIVLLGVTAHSYEFRESFALFASQEGMVLFFLVLIVVNILHEFGHGIMAKRYGCSVRTMGIALIFMIPVCYCDTTDAWKLKSRYQRQLINAGGILVETAIALLALLCWLTLPDSTAKSLAFFLAVTSLTTTLAINLNPFLKFDGYFLLADYFQIDNLQKTAFSAMRWQTRQWVTGLNLANPNPVSQAKHRKLCVYAACTWVYRFFLYLAIAWMVYLFWFKVIGLLLMVGVVVTLIIKPLVQEMSFYAMTTKTSGLTYRFTFFLCVIAVLLIAALVPLPRGISAPAVVTAVQASTYYAPAASQLKSIFVKNGETVKKGQLLAELHDPDLLYQQQELALQIQLLDERKRQQVTRSAQVKKMPVGRQDFEAKLEALANVEQQIAKLKIYANHTGRVTELQPWLKSGVWVMQNYALFNIVARNAEIHAYLDTRAVEKLSGLDGVFSSINGKNTIAARATSITKESIGSLDDKTLAVPHGGSISVNQTGDGTLMPLQDWHRINMTTEYETNREYTGYVTFRSEPHSLAASIGARIYGAILRESGF